MRIWRAIITCMSNCSQRALIRKAPQQQEGAALVEMALVLPVLAYMIFAIIQYGWLMMSMNMLTAAASSGAQVLASERGYNTPFTDTVSQIHAAAPALNVADITVTAYVDGLSCNSDASCAAAISAAQGKAATVTLSYKYTPIIADTMMIGLPSTLSVSMTGRIQ